MELSFGKVPELIRRLPQWVAWKSIGKDKRKVPFDPNTKKPAKAGDPTTWGTFEQATELYGEGGYAGIGFEFHDDEFVGIDLDGCRNPETKEIAGWAKSIIKKIGSYAEVSPSETGVKIIARGSSPFTGGKKKDVALKAVSDKAPGIEVYDRQRYFAITGWRLTGCTEIRHVPAPTIQAQWDALPSDAPSGGRMTDLERAAAYIAKCDGAVEGSSGHNTTFSVACSLILGFCLTPEEAAPIFREWNSRCAPPWSEKDLMRKLHEANKQSGERGYLRDAKQDTPMRSYAQQSSAPGKPPEKKQPEVKSVLLSESCKTHLDRLSEGPPELDTTGLPSLDKALDGGLKRGELVVIAARPSHGKSMFAMQLLHHMTLDAPALVVSEEMSADSLAQRSIQFASDVHKEYWFRDTEKVRGQVMNHFGWRQDVHIVEGVRTAHNAANAIREFHDKHGIQFAVVDYVQLLASNNRSGGRYETVTESSIAIKQVCLETGVTVFLLAQLGRDVEQREPFIPRNSDLKESGQLEQDADVILLLAWPHRLPGSTQPAGEYHVFVGKNKNRGIVKAAVQCKFCPPRQRVEEQPVEEDANYNSELDAFA